MDRLEAASFLQATGFRGDATRFRLKATAGSRSGIETAFRRNGAAGVDAVEAAHNPEVAGSNPAPATEERPAQAGLFLISLRTRAPTFYPGFYPRRFREGRFSHRVRKFSVVPASSSISASRAS